MTLTLDVGREPVPGYRLVRLLGEGGFGQVWQATAPGGVQVALKFIRLDTYQAHPELRALEVVKNIRHPNLLDIQFATRVQDRLVLATTLCDRSLWDRYEECRSQGLPGIPVDELLEYMQDAAKAIDFLNEVRHVGPDGRKVAVAHRDVKPHNIFLVGGSVKLADFGLVKALEQSAATNTGSMTPAYAAPELFSRTVSPRSDQWSLAVTYYQVRTSLLPFTGSIQEMMFAILQHDPDLAAIPPEERAIVARALEKDPQHRWQSCREFVRALNRAVPSRSSVTLSGTGGTGGGRSDRGGWGGEGPTLEAPQPGRGRNAGGYRFDTRPPSLASAETNQCPPSQPTPPEPMFSAKTETSSITQDIFDRPTVYLDRADLLPRPDKSEPSRHSVASTDSAGQRKFFAAGGVLLTAGILALAVYFSTRDFRPGPEPKPGENEQVTIDVDETKASKPDTPDPAAVIAKTCTLTVRVQPADLTLEVSPKAKVTVEGNKRTIQIDDAIGETSLSLVATRDGYQSSRQDVTLSPGDARSLDIQLKPLAATMTVEVEPPDAKLEVRGGSARVAVEGPLRRVEVDEIKKDLSLTLSVSARGYRNKEQEWKPKAADNQRIKIALDPYPAVLTIEVQPADSLVRVVSGNATITGSDRSRRIEVVKPRVDQSVVLLVSRAGHKEQRIEWNPQPAAVQRREIVLEPVTSAEITDSIGMSLALIAAGEFEMGSHQTPQELVAFYDNHVHADLFVDEWPAHRVALTQPIYMGKCEVTVGQFRAFVRATGYKTEAERDGKGGWGWNDRTAQFEQSPRFDWLSTGFHQTDEHPVVNVTFADAVAFCEWLSKKEGVKYRLPTEAEWEFACKAGAMTPYPFGDVIETVVGFGNTADATAKKVLAVNHPTWLFASSSDGYVFTSPVGSFRANAFGLYDTIGNVWEWCSDYYSPTYYAESPPSDPTGPDHGTQRVVRGAGWSNTAWNCRSSDRFAMEPSYRDFGIGFRVVRQIEPE